MDSENTSTQQTNNQQEHDWQNCRVRKVGDTGLIAVCLMEMANCDWAIPFVDKHFCLHPLREEFAIQKPAVTDF